MIGTNTGATEEVVPRLIRPWQAFLECAIGGDTGWGKSYAGLEIRNEFFDP